MAAERPLLVSRVVKATMLRCKKTTSDASLPVIASEAKQSRAFLSVMAGLDPGIHVFASVQGN
jgi:hypothetical protein